MKTQLNINVDVARVSKFKHWPHYWHKSNVVILDLIPTGKNINIRAVQYFKINMSQSCMHGYQKSTNSNKLKIFVGTLYS